MKTKDIAKANQCEIIIKNAFCMIFLMTVVSCVEVNESAFSNVLHEGGKTFIIDRTGHRWDITQAESLGFKPERFQYGLGKNAFTPLDDTHMTGKRNNVPEDLRVIGIAEGQEAKAYSVSRLKYHEIVNSTLGETPVAIGY